MELAYPGLSIFLGDGIRYLTVATLHGIIMVFFMVVPLIFGAFGNYLLPLQLGVHDVAFPRMNSAAFWFLPAGLIMLCQLLSLDKRFHTINCFSFKNIDSHIKLETLINEEDPIKHLTADSSVINKINFNSGLIASPKLKMRASGRIYSKILYTPKKKFNSLNGSAFTRSYYKKILIQKKLMRVESNPRFIHFPKNKYLINSKKLVNKNNVYYNYINTFPVFVNKCQKKISRYLFIYFNLFWNWWTEKKLFIVGGAKSYFLISPYDLFLQTRQNYWLYDYLTPPYLLKIVNKFYIINFKILFQTYIIKFNVNLIYFISLYFCYWTYISIFLKNNLNTLYLLYLINLEQFILLLPNKFSVIDYLFVKTKTLFLKPLLINNTSSKLLLHATDFNLNAVSFEVFIKRNVFSLTHDLKKFNDIILLPKQSSTRISTDNIKNNPANSIYTLYNTYTRTIPNIINIGNESKYAILSNTPYMIMLQDFISVRNNFFCSDKLLENVKLVAGLFTHLQHSMYLKKFYGRKPAHAQLENFDIKHNQYNINPLMYSTLAFKFYAANFVYNFRLLNLINTSVIFNNNIASLTNQSYSFNLWKNLRFQREFWRCRSILHTNNKTYNKFYSDWSFLFDVSNKFSIVSDSADVLPGWAFVTPFSSRVKYTKSGKTDMALFAIALSSFGSFISSVNFLLTYRYLSTLNNKKMRDARCFFTEGLLVGSGMMVAANPVLFIAILMLLSDRHWRTSFFDYSGGGDAVLFQHFFWFFGHPEVYIIIMPCFGFTNTMLSYFLRKRLSARASLLYSMYTIAMLGFFVWGHHMYMVGLSHHTRMLYSTITVMISIPAATKIMHWLVTLVNSAIHYELPLLFTLVFIFLFVSGGISGMAVAHTGTDILFHDTFYVIGHFHVMFAGAAMFSSFGAFYFYFPYLFGVKYHRLFAYLHFSYYLLGQFMTVVPMFWLGYAGMPRRIIDYPAVFGGWHSIISSGHMLSVSGLFAFFLMLTLSLRKKKMAIRTSFGVGRYNVRVNFYTYELIRLFYIKRKYYLFPRRKIDLNNKFDSFSIKKTKTNFTKSETKFLYHNIVGGFVWLLFYKFFLKLAQIDLIKFAKLKNIIDFCFLKPVINLINSTLFWKQYFGGGGKYKKKFINTFIYNLIKVQLFKILVNTDYLTLLTSQNTYELFIEQLIDINIVYKQKTNFTHCKAMYELLKLSKGIKLPTLIEKNSNFDVNLQDIYIFINTNIKLIRRIPYNYRGATRILVKILPNYSNVYYDFMAVEFNEFITNPKRKKYFEDILNDVTDLTKLFENRESKNVFELLLQKFDGLCDKPINKYKYTKILITKKKHSV